MAALMTSVIDNPGKVAEYILTCRQMGIADPAAGYQRRARRGFSVSGQNIRYGLSAIKSIGRPVIACAGAGAHRKTGLYKDPEGFHRAA